MVFSSLTFLCLFLPLLLVCYYFPLIKSHGYRNIILLLFSLFFYWWGEPKFFFIMVFSIFVNWCFGLLINKYHRKCIIVMTCIYNIGLLFIFKYMSFFTPYKSIALPIGISFFTFQMMSYVFDVYYGRASVQKNILNLALYVAMFPQLVAGPIVRYQTIENEIQNRNENLVDFSSGVKRFIVGLAKKVLLANNLAIFADLIFDGNLNNTSAAVAWLGALLYTLQIYYDFSGYSDMAIGLGKMFGFHFEENFDNPYLSDSVSSFWRRWHISMGTWFRDYVYFPLGGSRVNQVKKIRNLFVVWLLTGLWHGANWTFIIWGLYYFIILVIEKSSKRKITNSFFRHFITLLIIIFGWVLFRSNSLELSIEYLLRMFHFNGLGMFTGAGYLLKNCWVFIVMGILFCFPKVKNTIFNDKYITPYILCFLFTMIFVVKGGYNPFIYFNF